MQVHREINQLPSFKNAVITIGTFDGVHTGHLQIIKQLKQEAFDVQGESVIITFHPHPRMVLTAEQEPNNKPLKQVDLLNTLNELSVTIPLTNSLNSSLMLVPAPGLNAFGSSRILSGLTSTSTESVIGQPASVRAVTK